MGSAGSRMAEKWYFQNDTLNHEVEGGIARDATGLSARRETVFSYLFFFYRGAFARPSVPDRRL